MKEWNGRMKEWEKERFGYNKKAMGQCGNMLEWKTKRIGD